MKKEEENELFPPHIETYQKLGEYVYVSDLHQGIERLENIRLATFLAEKTKEIVFILPIIQPSIKNSKELRERYLPVGVKENKNPDFYFRGRFVDGKSMTNITFTDDEELFKRKIQSRIKEAFTQADDVFIEIPTMFFKSWILSSVYGKLNSSKHSHIVYIKYGDELIKIKKPDKYSLSGGG